MSKLRIGISWSLSKTRRSSFFKSVRSARVCSVFSLMSATTSTSTSWVSDRNVGTWVCCACANAGNQLYAIRASTALFLFDGANLMVDLMRFRRWSRGFRTLNREIRLVMRSRIRLIPMPAALQFRQRVEAGKRSAFLLGLLRQIGFGIGLRQIEVHLGTSRSHLARSLQFA